MLSKRKRVMAKRTLPPMYIQNPPYQPMYPTNQPPEYLHHGNIVRAPLNHPPVAAHYQPGPYPDWHYQPNRPVYNPHPQYPVNPPIIYDNSHYNYYHPNYPQPLAYSQVSEHGSILPPQNNLLLTSTRTVSPNVDSEYQAFNVTDLTEHRSHSPMLSSRDAIDKKDKYYDRLQKTYH